MFSNSGPKAHKSNQNSKKAKNGEKNPTRGLETAPYLANSLTGWAKGAGVIILAVKMYLFLQLIWNSLFELYWLANVIY
jgi:hypothetical protein